MPFERNASDRSCRKPGLLHLLTAVCSKRWSLVSLLNRSDNNDQHLWCSLLSLKSRLHFSTTQPVRLNYSFAVNQDVTLERRRILTMESLHRKPERSDFRNGRDCCYCSCHDPKFSERKSPDRLVHPKLNDVASAHLTEDGYVKHRLVELAMRRSSGNPLLKCA